MDQTNTAAEIILGGQKFAPEGEMLKFHVVNVEEGEGTNFDTGAAEPRIVVTTVLDSEGETQGQTYKMWLKNSLHPKSTMAKLLLAVFGKTEPATRSDLLGMPFQATLKRNEAGTRQNFDAFFKPAKDQERVDVDTEVVPDDVIDVEALFADKD